MKKKLNFIISLLLVVILAASAFSVPVASYENDVKTSSSAMLLVNLDTGTVCYSKNPDTKWYASYMSELMTFLVAAGNISDPAKTKVEVTQEFLYSLPYNDGSLDLFIGEQLTVKDLLAIMMITPGSDAAYLIADTVSDGDIYHFVELMNKKAEDLGCTMTNFVTPGYSDSGLQYTCCSDLWIIFDALHKIPLYSELMGNYKYTPEGFETEDDSYEVMTENSILNPQSPYYFRYATGGKYCYSVTSKANIMVTTTYRGKSYLFVALRGKSSSEQNTFADAKKMTTWAYLNLSDRKVIDVDNSVSEYTVTTDWGSYKAELYASNSAFKTLPMDYEAEKLSYQIHIPDSVSLPIFEGQSIGNAAIFYEKENIEDVNLVSGGAEGIGLLNDMSHFMRYAVSEVLEIEPPTESYDVDNNTDSKKSGTSYNELPAGD